MVATPEPEKHWSLIWKARSAAAESLDLEKDPKGTASAAPARQPQLASLEKQFGIVFRAQIFPSGRV